MKKKKKGMLKKGIVKEMIERMKRQNNKETSSIQTICKKLELFEHLIIPPSVCNSPFLQTR